MKQKAEMKWNEKITLRQRKISFPFPKQKIQKKNKYNNNYNKRVFLSHFQFKSDQLNRCFGPQMSRA